MSQISSVKISQADTRASSEDRFHRFKLIGWWDQSKLTHAKVLVVGAGALGNELVKNLALLGVGQVLIADMDRIENSNLSRSVLFRQKHNGQSKALVAAAAARDLYPDMKVQAFDGNIVHDLGLGVFRWADVVLGGLDNREARLAINRACYKVGRPWIDGAIEQIQGCVRVFSPPGPCYECTMSQTDWKLLQMRRSCNLLSRKQMLGGKTPTTPTISSIIAGVEAQEAVKLLHGMDHLSGTGWVFNGLSTESYAVNYPRKEDCYSHDPIHEVISLDQGVADMAVGQLMEHARERLGSEVQLELAREILERVICPRCGEEQTLFTSLGKVTEEQGTCQSCGMVECQIKTFFKIRGDEAFLDQSLASIGVPPFDIVLARGKTQCIGFELTGDAPSVLGDLLQTQEDIEWL